MKSSLAAFLIFLLTVIPAAAQTEKPPQSFPDQLHEALMLAQVGAWDESEAAFETLRRNHPHERLVYFFHAEGREMRGDYDGTEMVLREALKAVQPLDDETRRVIEERLAALETKKAFALTMQEALPWEKAQVYGTAHFHIRTNLPGEYARALGKKLETHYRAIEAELQALLGEPREPAAYTPVVAFGRWQDWRQYHASRSGAMPELTAAYYDPTAREIVMLFENAMDWRRVAHEMTHALMWQRYTRNASVVLSEGLADYISLQLEQETSMKLEIRKRLNWYFDQGRWQGFADFEQVMTEYVKLTNDVQINARRRNGDTWHLADLGMAMVMTRQFFYSLSWSLMDFFLESGNAKWRAFFEEYLRYEMTMQENAPDAFFRYVEGNLSKAEIKELEDLWFRHVLNDAAPAPQPA